MADGDTENKSDRLKKLIQDQIHTAELVNSMNAFLDPWEGFAKLGISLTTGLIALLVTSIPLARELGHDLSRAWLLLLILVVLLTSILFGILQLWRGIIWREVMREGAFHILGEQLNEDQIRRSEKMRKQKYAFCVKVQWITLFSAIILLVVWLALLIYC